MSDTNEIPAVDIVDEKIGKPLALETKLPPLPIKNVEQKLDIPVKPASKRKKGFGATISFLILVLIPFITSVVYYASIASDQYRSEALFTVRGTTTSPLASLGMLSLPGASAQSGDSYIVTEYVRSSQIINDIKELTGLDVRTKFSDPGIDWLYRVDAQMPLVRFIDYWRWMTAVEFNSTTGVISFNVDAFNAEDAQEIAQAVLMLSEQLVNKLSDDAKKQVIASASDDVSRNVERLNLARLAVEEFRNKEQIIDVTGAAQTELTILQELQKQDLELRGRRDSLASTATNSPIVRSLDSQIAVVQQQIATQKEKVGTGTTSTAKNISSLATEYQQLLISQEFAEKAFLAAQNALEIATQEARKQERYLAVVLEPTQADYPMYPKRVINVLMVLMGSLLIWLLVYLLSISVREHTR